MQIYKLLLWKCLGEGRKCQPSHECACQRSWFAFLCKSVFSRGLEAAPWPALVCRIAVQYFVPSFLRVPSDLDNAQASEQERCCFVVPILDSSCGAPQPYFVALHFQVDPGKVGRDGGLSCREVTSAIWLCTLEFQEHGLAQRTVLFRDYTAYDLSCYLNYIVSCVHTCARTHTHTSEHSSENSRRYSVEHCSQWKKEPAPSIPSKLSLFYSYNF